MVLVERQASSGSIETLIGDYLKHWIPCTITTGIGPRLFMTTRPSGPYAIPCTIYSPYKLVDGNLASDKDSPGSAGTHSTRLDFREKGVSVQKKMAMFEPSTLLACLCCCAAAAGDRNSGIHIECACRPQQPGRRLAKRTHVARTGWWTNNSSSPFLAPVRSRSADPSSAPTSSCASRRREQCGSKHLLPNAAARA